MNRTNYNLQILLSLALVSEVIYVLLASFENIKAHIPIFLICYGTAFVIYWVAGVNFFDFIKKHKMKESLSIKEVLIVGIVFGVFFRLTLLFSPLSLSDDIYRYVWDGRVASHGINPFQHPPQAEALSSLRDNEIYPKINHKEISTIYPPVNQLTFLGLYKLHPSVLAFKAAFLGFDLLTIWVLFLILKRLSINLKRLLIYVWNPLIIVEFSGSGHVDIQGIFILTLSLWLLIKNRTIWSTFAISLSFLTKYLALLFLPLITFFKKENKLMIVLIFIITTTALYLPFADAKEGLFAGLFVYSNKWRFNDSIFAVIFSMIKSILPENWIINLMIIPQGLTPDSGTIATRGTDLALDISKLIVGIIFAFIFIYYLLRLKKDFMRVGTIWIFKLGLIFLGTFLLLSPTVHPWYLCWLLPFLVIVPNRAWIFLTGLVGLSYWILIDYSTLGRWQETLWVKWLEYLPFYFLLIYDMFVNRFVQRRPIMPV